MKTCLSILAIPLALPLFASAVDPAEEEAGFTALSDGQSFQGWKHSGNWTIEDGAFYRNAKGGSLTYTAATVPDDFELRFDWKVSKGCNSGVYYRPGQVEYQILDNVHSPYGENARQAAGSLFFGMAPREDATKPFGQWNSGRIVCDGTVIEHWINGQRVISFDYADPKWAEYIDLLGIRGGDLTGRGGRLWLQDHGQDVWFRNLRWREIPGDEIVEADPTFEPMPVTGRALEKEQARVARMRASREAKAPRPNIVWIMADDLGWGDVGCYGPSPIPTPNIDRVAAEGLRFTDAHSPSAICSPTRYGVLTGSDPFRRYHTSHVLFNGEPLVIRPGEATVASILQEAGYTTAAIGKWHLGLGDTMPRNLHQPGRGPNQTGFDYSFLVADGHNMLPHYYLENGTPYGRSAAAEFPAKLHVIDRVGYRLLRYRPEAKWPDFRPVPEIAATLVEKATTWLEQSVEAREETSKGKPFFLYLPTCAIHDPHRPSPQFAGKSGIGAHGDFVMQFDWTVGEMVATLERLGVAENTLLFVTSDNGGLSRGGKKHGHDSSGPWRGHKGQAWEGGHRVPLLARWPAKIEAGRTSEALVSLTDLTATAANLAGGFVPPQAALDSIDQSPVLLGDKKNVRSALMMATRGCEEIVRREGSHKAILDPEADTVRFFNLADNPGESESPTATAPEWGAAMTERLHRYFREGSSRPRAIGRPGSVAGLFEEKARRNQHIHEQFGQQNPVAPDPGKR